MPISVVSMQLGKMLHARGTPLRGDKNWLKDLTLGIKNTSGKSIVFIYIELVIENQGKLPPGMRLGIPMSVGNPRAPLDRGSDLSDRVPLVVKPGEIIPFAISEDSFKYWSKFFRQYEVEDFTRIIIDIESIHYDDGTGWKVGFETRQDPDNPSRWSVFGTP